MVYVADLPVTCPKYYGEHSLDCLKTVWLNVGCLKQGHEFPDKLPLAPIQEYSALNYT